MILSFIVDEQLCKHRKLRHNNPTTGDLQAVGLINRITENILLMIRRPPRQQYAACAIESIPCRAFRFSC